MTVKDMTENLGLQCVQLDLTENGILKACSQHVAAVRVNLPIIGSFLSSRAVVKRYLETVVDFMSEDAIKLNMTLVYKRKESEV